MKPQIENLGKVSVTVEQQYWAKDSQYDRLTIVEDIDTIASYISRKDVPAGIDINNREYWIPLGRVSDYLENFVEKESGMLQYLEQSVHKALEDNQKFHNNAKEEVETTLNNLTEVITTALNTINTTDTTVNNNESDRITAENKRVIAENERVTKENERIAAEALRQNAETNREAAEEERQRKYTNEYDAYENNRRNAETLRNAAESARQEQEAYRINNEESREDAESIRQGAENVRNSSETSRQQGEQARVTAENNRVVAEIDRQLQEGNYSDKPDANGSRWARFHQAQSERSTIAQQEENNRNATFNNAETTRQEAYETAESRRDKELENAVSILDTYETKLNNKANIDGSYFTMTVGAAETLLGNNVITAKYTYRPTADTTDVADGVAKISSVKGNTIVWNQKCPNNVTFTTNNISFEILNGLISMNGTLQTIYLNIVPIVTGNNPTIRMNLNHIGYYKCTIVKDLNAILQNKVFGLLNRHAFVNIVGSTASLMYKNTDDSIGWGFGISGFTVGDVIEDVQIKVNVFDLTQMFGEGNEPTLEEFEAMFPDDYYEYNEGELKSIEDFQIKSVGFNQWDEEYKKGYYDTDGNFVSTPNGNYICSVKPIKAFPSTTYSIICPLTVVTILEKDDNDNILSRYPLENGRPETQFTFTTLPQTKFMHIIFGAAGYPINNSDGICINLSHSGIRNGEYEPYQEDVLPINISTIKDENGEQLFPNGLCSAGTAHDELVYDKGIGKWKAVKRIGSVDMGSLSWRYISISDNYPYGVFDTDNKNIINRLSRGSLICSKYIKSSSETFKTDKRIISGGSLYIVDTAYTDSETFKQSLQGQILYYELAEPIEVVLDVFTSNYKVSDWGTEEILMNSIPVIPVIYDVEYARNAVDTLRNMPTNYISKESLDAFLSALGSAMGGTWTTTYNETNGRYDFSFSANASATELTEE